VTLLTDIVFDGKTGTFCKTGLTKSGLRLCRAGDPKTKTCCHQVTTIIQVMPWCSNLTYIPCGERAKRAVGPILHPWFWSSQDTNCRCKQLSWMFPNVQSNHSSRRMAYKKNAHLWAWVSGKTEANQLLPADNCMFIFIVWLKLPSVPGSHSSVNLLWVGVSHTLFAFTTQRSCSLVRPGNGP
jgi:hypothetical protein